jgi:uncharacterized membrane protein
MGKVGVLSAVQKRILGATVALSLCYIAMGGLWALSVSDAFLDAGWVSVAFYACDTVMLVAVLALFSSAVTSAGGGKKEARAESDALARASAPGKSSSAAKAKWLFCLCPWVSFAFAPLCA